MGSSLRSLAGAPYHLASAFAYALRRGTRRRADESAVAEAAWSRSSRAADLPPGVELEWLGTAGFRISYQGFDLLIDPYLTRLPFADVVRGRVVRASFAPGDDGSAVSWELPQARRKRRAAPGPRAVAARLPHASAILVGHTHFDHALDVPALARAAGCPVYGSASLARLMALHGEAARAVEVEPHRTYEVGPFAFHFVPSRHSRLALGLWTPSDGELSCEHLDELTPRAYRCGQVWGIHIAVAGATFYHQGSADLIEGEIRDRGVDYFLMGIAGRRFAPRYVERALRALDPRVVVPHHFDDFFKPLAGAGAGTATKESGAPKATAQGPGFSLNVNVAGFLDEVAAVTRDVEVRFLESR